MQIQSINPYTELPLYTCKTISFEEVKNEIDNKIMLDEESDDDISQEGSDDNEKEEYEMIHRILRMNLHKLK